MPERHTELLKIGIRQIARDLEIDVIDAETIRVFAEADRRQPRLDICHSLSRSGAALAAAGYLLRLLILTACGADGPYTSFEFAPSAAQGAIGHQFIAPESFYRKAKERGMDPIDWFTENVHPE
jgi:hypothetical protein